MQTESTGRVGDQMSEELYNSNDFYKLAEELEELKKENAELARDKDYLINLFMERSEYVFNVVANMKIESLTRKCKALEADYAVSNREMLLMQVEIGELKSELARLNAELAELRERFEVTDDLLNQATVTIGAVIACCTYNSNEDAKVGIYGISPDAFTRIDQFITNYKRAVSAGKVSVDVKPVQRPADPSLEEDEFDSMPIEKINQYLREHGYNPEKVGLRGKILAEALTKNIIAHKIIQRFIDDPYGCRFCDFGVLRKPGIPEKDHDEDCLYLAARAYLDNDTSTVVRRNLSDFEIEDLGAQEAEKRGEND